MEGTMNYYKLNKEVYAFSDDQLQYVKPDMIAMTDNEVQAHIAAQQTAYKKLRLAPLTRRQFKLILLENDLLNQIETSISAIPDDKLRARIQIEYIDATEFKRTGESVIYMCTLLGLTDDQVDAIWEQALLL